jgi:hypothetical protein
MLIGLTGAAGVGKDTVAQLLREHFGFTHIAIADGLKNVVTQLADSLLLPGADTATLAWAIEGYGSLEAAKRADPRVRQLLIDVGCGMREVMGDDVWLNLADRNIADAHDTVVSDITFYNEAYWLVRRCGWLLEITRSGFTEERVPGNKLTYPPDALVANDGTQEELLQKLRVVMGEWA